MKLRLLSVLILGGCTTLDARLPDISQSDLDREQRLQEKSAFSEMTTLRERLMRVAHPVMKENADICKTTRFDIGASTHTLKSYSKTLRPGAERELGARDEPTLNFVRPGSPADRSGLQTGDVLLDENGKHVALPTAKFDEHETLTRMRNGQESPVALTPERICGYDIKLKMTPTINAYATGKSIIVTSGMINFVNSDDELALIIGHELAHNEMGHVRKIVTNILLSGFATRYTRPFESEADYVGMYYMARAGYALENVEQIWRRLGTLSPRGIARAKTHPIYPDRYLRLVATRKEIEEKTSGGKELLPNMKGTR